MERKAIENKVREALAELLDEKAQQIGAQARLISDVKLESIDMIDFLFEIERKLGVSINLSEAFSVKRRAFSQKEQFDLTIDEVVSYLEELLR